MNEARFYRIQPELVTAFFGIYGENIGISLRGRANLVCYVSSVHDIQSAGRTIESGILSLFSSDGKRIVHLSLLAWNKPRLLVVT